MKRGFTLIEILLALLILTIGVVSMVGVLSTALGSNVKARDDLNMVSFADLILNHCHALEDWSTIPTSGIVALTDYNENLLNLQLGTLGQFTSQTVLNDGTTLDQYTVSYQIDIVNNGNSKTITLQVWPGYTPSGQPRLFQTEIYNWNKS